MVLWDFIPNSSSRDDIVYAMKMNLEQVDHTDIKEFHFSINNPYQKAVIGEGPYRSTTMYRLLPDFTGDTEEAATRTCSEYGIKCTFVGDKGTVTAQSEPFRKRIDLMKDGLVLTLSGDKTKDKDKDKDKDKELDDDDDDDGDEGDDNGGNNTDPDPSPSPSPSSDPEDDED